MSGLPFLQFYPADYHKDTRRLTTLQHGAYFLLIVEYWTHGGLPEDEEEIRQITGLSVNEWEKNRNVLARFFSEGWVHGRIERDLAKAQEKNSKRVEAGKAGASARYKKANPSNASSIADGNRLAFSSEIQKDTPLRSVSCASSFAQKKTTTNIPDDAIPSEDDHDHALRIGMCEDIIRTEWAIFRDWHIKEKLNCANWGAAWRLWCANWLDSGAGGDGLFKPMVEKKTRIEVLRFGMPSKEGKKKQRKMIEIDRRLNQENIRICTSNGMGHEISKSEWEKFKNHHLAKGTLMLDWDRAWITWVGNWKEGKYRNTHTTYDKKSALNIAREAHEQSAFEVDQSKTSSTYVERDGIWDEET